MNKRYHVNHSTRIAQLADQAHEESNLVYYEQLKTKKADQVIFYDIFNQRLAELVIRECAEVCMKEIDTGWVMAPKSPWMAKQILEHFGLE